jgi:hypothetical protein
VTALPLVNTIDPEPTIMTTDPNDPPAAIEMPAPTIWPLVLALGITLLLAGPITNLAISVVGAMVGILGIVFWVAALTPGAGKVAEELAAQRPRPIQPVPGRVEALRPGMPGYRVRIPEKIHPYSAGLKGGIAGGILMTVPALAYGLIGKGSIWFPLNLLAGMVVPGFIPGDLPSAQELVFLEQFHFSALVAGIFIHAVISMGLGLIYGVILPTLPGSPIIWGGIVLPLLWTGGAYAFMGVINPVLENYVEWPYFILSQFIFGIAAAVVVTRSEKVHVRQ